MNRQISPHPLILFAFLALLASCSSVNKNNDLKDKTAEIMNKSLEQADTYYNQGLVWDIKGNFDRAVIYYTKALEINPRHAQANNCMAWLLATCPDEKYRNGVQAIDLAKNAVNINPEADFLDTLAASYAEKGNFEDAIEVQERAINALIREGKTDKVVEYNAHLACYKVYNPWRKTNCIEAFKTPVVKVEAAIPGPTNQGKDSAPDQDTGQEQVSAKKAEIEILQQISETKTPEIKQNVHLSLQEKAAQKNTTALPRQTGERPRTKTPKNFYPYTIHVSSFRNNKRSNDLALGLKDQGAPAFTCPIHIPGKGDWTRVFVGHFKTLEETRKAASKLRGEKDIYPLESKMPYAVQVGIFDSDHKSHGLEADLRSKSYLTYSMPDRTDNNKIRLLIGAYKTEEDAARLSKKLHEEGFDSKVVRR